MLISQPYITNKITNNYKWNTNFEYKCKQNSTKTCKVTNFLKKFKNTFPFGKLLNLFETNVNVVYFHPIKVLAWLKSHIQENLNSNNWWMAIPIGLWGLDYRNCITKIETCYPSFPCPFSLNIYNSLNLNYYQAESILWHLNSKLFPC
jgi:hypothetical protein